MCGIVGYFGPKNAQEVLISGLSKLEYRGYDSAGITVVCNNELKTSKAKGKLVNLSEKLEKEPLNGNLGIGHTRWATHGEPSDINSHPHNSSNDLISVVHNGIIENYLELKEKLIKDGYNFKSETDTEVIPNLIHHYYKESKDLLGAVVKAVSVLRGSFAIAVISAEEPDRLIAVRKDSPLVVGVGENEVYLASDVPAILNYTRQVIYLNDLEFVDVKNGKATFFNSNREELKKETTEITWSADAAEKGGYDHFTLKEIHEQPKALKDTMTGRIIPGEPVKLDDITLTKEDILRTNRVYIVACGTAYHAGLVGKHAIEKLARIPVETEVASEFRYKDPIIDDKSLLIVVSQSGETADTLAVLRDAKAKGARVIAVTNVVGSSIAREATDVLYTWAGPEIGVASTKAYLTQLIAMYTIALKFVELMESRPVSEINEIKKAMLALPEKVEEVLKTKEQIQKYASSIYAEKDIYFLGRGLDYATAIEASLKLKELTYIHSDAYQGGELKHGPIALIEANTKVVCPLTQDDLVEKMVSNIKEVVTRGAKVLTVVTKNNVELAKKVSDTVVEIPETMNLLAPVISIVPLQLLAYYVCSLKGLDVDKPRNLAKSVTVE